MEKFMKFLEEWRDLQYTKLPQEEKDAQLLAHLNTFTVREIMDIESSIILLAKVYSTVTDLKAMWKEI